LGIGVLAVIAACVVAVACTEARQPRKLVVRRPTPVALDAEVPDAGPLVAAPVDAGLDAGVAVARTGRFFQREDRPIRAALANGPIASVERGHGGRSLGFKVTLEDGTVGYFKPAQEFSGMRWYAELAAFALDRELGLGRVAPSVGRRIAWSELEDAAGDDPRVDELEVDRDGTLPGAFIFWVPERLRPLALPEGWEAWLRVDEASEGAEVTPFQRPGEHRRALAAAARRRARAEAEAQRRADADPHPDPLPEGEGAAGADADARADPHPDPLPEGEGAAGADADARADPHPDPLPEGEGAAGADADARADADADTHTHAELDVPTPDRPERPAELSDMMVFDYLTQNIDRWGTNNTNIRTVGDGGPLMFLDNGACFTLRRPHVALMDARLAEVQRFRRSTIDAVRTLDLSRFAERLAEEPLGPLLDEEQLENLGTRRANLLAHVDALVERYGEDEVYAW
jgi:hypothetical protein